MLIFYKIGVKNRRWRKPLGKQVLNRFLGGHIFQKLMISPMPPQIF